MTGDDEVLRRLSRAAIIALTSKGMAAKLCACPVAPPEIRIHFLPKYTNSATGPNSYHPYVAAFCRTCGLSHLYHARTLIGREEFRRIVKDKM